MLHLPRRKKTNKRGCLHISTPHALHSSIKAKQLKLSDLSGASESTYILIAVDITPTSSRQVVIIYACLPTLWRLAPLDDKHMATVIDGLLLHFLEDWTPGKNGALNAKTACPFSCLS